jgi:hypothetical protein
MNKRKHKFYRGAALAMVQEAGNRRAQQIWLAEREAL